MLHLPEVLGSNNTVAPPPRVIDAGGAIAKQVGCKILNTFAACTSILCKLICSLAFNAVLAQYCPTLYLSHIVSCLICAG